MKYRAKPVVIDAVRVSDLVASAESLEPWAFEAWEFGKLTVRADSVLVETADGDERAEHSDWIVRDASGALSVCKTEIFEASYERVPSSALPWIDTYRKNKT